MPSVSILASDDEPTRDVRELYAILIIPDVGTPTLDTTTDTNPQIRLWGDKHGASRQLPKTVPGVVSARVVKVRSTTEIIDDEPRKRKRKG